MPNHGKGGRKPERGEAKTAAVAVRTTPGIKAQLEAAARAAGRSVTQEIEHRLSASLAVPSAGATAELLAAIAADIARAEELTGKHWHKDLRTWAMVREALASGEIEARAPEMDRLLTEGDSEADELLTSLIDYESKLSSLALAATTATGWPVPINMNGIWDVRLPRYNYADVREQLADHATDDTRAVMVPILDKMEQLEAERSPIANEYQQHQEAILECIEQAVSQWEADWQARGRQLAREYRPAATLRPVRDAGGRTTGVWVEGEPDPMFAKYLPEGGSIGPKPAVRSLLKRANQPEKVVSLELTPDETGVLRSAEAHKARRDALEE